MSYFNNYNDFIDLKKEILNKNRFFVEGEIKKFLDALEKKAAEKIFILKITTSIFRA